MDIHEERVTPAQKRKIFLDEVDSIQSVEAAKKMRGALEEEAAEALAAIDRNVCEAAEKVVSIRKEIGEGNVPPVREICGRMQPENIVDFPEEPKIGLMLGIFFFVLVGIVYAGLMYSVSHFCQLPEIKEVVEKVVPMDILSDDVKLKGVVVGIWTATVLLLGWVFNFFAVSLKIKPFLEKYKLSLSLLYDVVEEIEREREEIVGNPDFHRAKRILDLTEDLVKVEKAKRKAVDEDELAELWKETIGSDYPCRKIPFERISEMLDVEPIIKDNSLNIEWIEKIHNLKVLLENSIAVR